MRHHLLTGILLSVALAAALPGCSDAALRADKEKMAKPQREAFERERMSMIYQVAEQEYQVGDFEKCRATLKSTKDLATPFAPLHVLAAKVELEGGNLETASAELKKAVTIDATQAESFYLLGVVYQRWQKFDNASDYYQQAADKNPSEALYVLAVAEMRITLGQLDEAKQLLEDKMVFFEQSAAMRIALARIADLQGDKAQAAAHYRDATLLLPEDKNLRWTYAISLYDAGKYSEAARVLEVLREDPPAMPKAARTSAGQGAAESDADAQAAESIKVGLLMTLGQCYDALKRSADARVCFQEVMRLEPANVSAYLALGKTCLTADDPATTIAAAQKALRFEPDNVDAMLLLAAAQQKQVKWGDALATLTRAAKAAPQNQTVFCLMGISQMQLGQKEAAVISLQKAVAIRPTDAWATQLLLKVKPDAIPALQPAPHPTPDDATPAASNTPVTEPTPALTTAQPAGDQP